MPRHFSEPLEPDKRLHRPHPNLLPSHRRCTLCKLILPLDALHFYERSGERYKWNLSFYGTRCKPCASKAAMERKAAQRDKVNQQARQRREAKKEAERLQSPASKAAREEAERRSLQESFERRQHLAWVRKSLRASRSGPYIDAVKLMIKRRQEEYAQQRQRNPVISEDIQRASALSFALNRPAANVMEAVRLLHAKQKHLNPQTQMYVYKSTKHQLPF